MNKSEYIKRLIIAMNDLRDQAVEIGQDRMLDQYYYQELDRLELFDAKETFFKEVVIGEFNHFQGYYRYENNVQFTSLEMRL